MCCQENKSLYYTIPSDNRELQPEAVNALALAHYTIPSDNRELQLMPMFNINNELYHTK